MAAHLHSRRVDVMRAASTTARIAQLQRADAPGVLQVLRRLRNHLAGQAAFDEHRWCRRTDSSKKSLIVSKSFLSRKAYPVRGRSS